MQTAGVTREGLGPRANAPDRYGNHLDSTEIQQDGRVFACSYGAHWHAAVSDGLGNAIRYTLDAMGNRTKEEVKDPSGALVRSQRRVYDALNRVQNLVMPAQ